MNQLNIVNYRYSPLYFVMAKKTTLEMKVQSVRLPARIWSIVRNLANKNYRSLNNQILKIFEDWLVEHGYMEENERSKFDE